MALDLIYTEQRPRIRETERKNTMRTVVRKWGNSLALRLPQHLAADLRIVEGATVTLTVEDQTLIVKPARKRLRLADLPARMKGGKKQKEFDWGRPKGEEVW